MMLVEGQSADSIKLYPPYPLVNLHKPWPMRKVVISAQPACKLYGNCKANLIPSINAIAAFHELKGMKVQVEPRKRPNFDLKEFAGYSKLIRSCMGTIGSDMMLIHSIATDTSIIGWRKYSVKILTSPYAHSFFLADEREYALLMR